MSDATPFHGGGDASDLTSNSAFRWYRQYRKLSAQHGWTPKLGHTPTCEELCKAFEEDELAQLNWRMHMGARNPGALFFGATAHSFKFTLAFCFWSWVFYFFNLAYYMLSWLTAILYAWPLEVAILLLMQHRGSRVLSHVSLARLRVLASAPSSLWITGNTSASQPPPNLPRFVYPDRLHSKTDPKIRIIIIHPGAGNMPIVCTLNSGEKMDRIRDYETLSYCWGNGRMENIIICNGKALLVNSNLLGALRALRLSHKPRRVWIDAISINQDDATEKACQVRLMPKIYQMCTKVIVWLGEHSQHAETAASILNIIWRDVRPAARQNRQALVKAFNEDAHALLRNFKLPGLINNAWESLGEILHDPYWNRMWIIQEVTLGPHPRVLFGQEELNLDCILYMIQFLQIFPIPYLSNGRCNGLGQLSQFRENFIELERYGKLDGRDLWSLIRSTRFSQATDPRDKVFALYGLTNDPSHGGIDLEVDYERNHRDIFRHAALRLLDTSQSLFMLNLASTVPYPDPQLESWALDHCYSTGCLLLPWADGLENFYPHLKDFLAADSDYRVERSEENWRLIIKAVVQKETILDVGPVMEDKRTSSNDHSPESKSYMATNIYHGWISMAMRGYHRERRDDRIVELFCTLNMASKPNQAFQHWLRFQCYRARVGYLRLYLIHWIFHEIVCIAVIFPLQILGLLDAGPKNWFAFPFCNQRRLCLTSSGHLVMAPARTKKGDKIVLARGSQLPLIVRDAFEGATLRDQSLVGCAWIPKLASFASDNPKVEIGLSKAQV
jgi:hypothetical protein